MVPGSTRDEHWLFLQWGKGLTQSASVVHGLGWHTAFLQITPAEQSELDKQVEGQSVSSKPQKTRDAEPKASLCVSDQLP